MDIVVGQEKSVRRGGLFGRSTAIKGKGLRSTVDCLAGVSLTAEERRSFRKMPEPVKKAG